jgi:hypothetical protein
MPSRQSPMPELSDGGPERGTTLSLLRTFATSWFDPIGWAGKDHVAPNTP